MHWFESIYPSKKNIGYSKVVVGYHNSSVAFDAPRKESIVLMLPYYMLQDCATHTGVTHKICYCTVLQTHMLHRKSKYQLQTLWNAE